MSIPARMIGNDFTVPAARATVAPVATLPVAPVVAAPQPVDFTPPHQTAAKEPLHKRAHEQLHAHSFIVFSLLFLMIAAAATQLAGEYWGKQALKLLPHAAPTAVVRPIGGLNVTVPDKELNARLQTITNQTATLTVGTQTKQLSPDTLRSWLQITPDKAKGLDYIHISASSIGNSLKKVANQYVNAPVNQISVTHDGVTTIIAAGRNGTQLTDPSTLDAQAALAAKNVLSAKGGLQFTTPMQTLAYSTVGPTAFHKMIEVNLASKQMWLYEDGNIVKNYLVSAGKPSTPTPVGQFKIFSKLAVQDMVGYNADGSKYFQPHVHWINYFLPGGYAIHGVYWHGSTWFGNINSSHGCVGIPDNLAKEVYDWAPIGTTVITHN